MKRFSSLYLNVSISMFLFILSAHGTQLVFENSQFSFQALRVIGYTASGCADIGDCLSTCYRITDGDVESWYSEWLGTAQMTEAKAEDYLDQGFTESARECYFRASGYYRAAEFFLHTEMDDPRMLQTWEKSRDAFLSAASLSERPIIPIRIPFEDGYIPAYLCLVDSSGVERPILLSHSGFDGTKEELYFSLGSAAVERGYNCLLFEGPGQGEAIRVQGLCFIPDWESVVTPVVDYALGLPFVDPERIALVGYSMGGYLAPRAVAYEHRIAACVANGAVYSMYESALGRNPPGTDELLDDEEASRQYDQVIYGMMDDVLFVKWFYTNGMWTFGADSPSDFMRMMRAYTMDGCVREVSCNMLLLDSQNDQLACNQAMVLFDSLQCPKEYILFTEQEGADEHCQMGALFDSNERIFNWLDSVLLITPVSS
mgnify:CR=1 FL=1